MKRYQIFQKLPTLFQKDPSLSQIALHLEDSSVFFSSIFYRNQNRNKIILKSQGVPYFEKDWHAFCIMRAQAKTFIISGSLLRAEPDLFLSRSIFGNPLLEQLYQNLQSNQKQKVAVITNHLTLQDCSRAVSDKYYNFLSFKKSQKINEILGQIHSRQDNLPINFQIGSQIFHKFFKEVEYGSPNLVDTLLLTFFEGQLDQKYIGEDFSFDFLKHYDLKWNSELHQIEWEGRIIGKVQFEIYKKK